MRTRTASRGFTLIELLIVLTVLTIVLTIALPVLLSSKMAASEAAALSTLDLLVKAQLHFQSTCVADEDGNGVGEFGTFGELSASVPVRQAVGGTALLAPQFVSPAFRGVSDKGLILRDGYLFRIFLPDLRGEGLPELPRGGASADVYPRRAEVLWCAYAWPQRYDTTGRRTFFANQSGSILSTEDLDYSGEDAVIPAGSALAFGRPIQSMLGPMAIGEPARDGNIWRSVAH